MVKGKKQHARQAEREARWRKGSKTIQTHPERPGPAVPIGQFPGGSLAARARVRTPPQDLPVAAQDDAERRQVLRRAFERAREEWHSGDPGTKTRLLGEIARGLVGLTGPERVRRIDEFAAEVGMTPDEVCAGIAAIVHHDGLALLGRVDVGPEEIALRLRDPAIQLARPGLGDASLAALGIPEGRATSNPDGSISIESDILAHREGLLRLPVDGAVQIIVGWMAERRHVETDMMTLLKLAGDVLAPLPRECWGPHLERLAVATGISVDRLGDDLLLLARDARYERIAPPVPPARPPHWRDALQGLADVRDYWREQERMGLFDQQMLDYGRGWTNGTETYAEKLARHGYGEERGRRLVATVGALVRQLPDEALPFYVAPPIADLLTQAAETIPETTLTPELLPARVGLLWFGRPLDFQAHADEDERERFRFTADDLVKASRYAEHLADPTPEQERQLRASGGLDSRPQLQAVLWHPLVTRARGGDDAAAEHLCVSCYFRHQIPDSLPIELFSVAYEVSFVVGYGETLNPGVATIAAATGDDYAAPGLRWIVDVLATTLLFLRQRIVRPEASAVQNKNARRALAKTLRREPPEVQVIRLREFAPAPTSGDDDPSDKRQVEWKGRWLVRGHWRQQACGPGRSQRRPLYIAPFVKGDPSKPLILRKKVVTVQR